MFGHQQMQVAINTINELVAEAGKPKWTWAAPAADANMVAALKTAIGDRLNEAFSGRDKLERKDAISVLKKDVIAGLSEPIEATGWNPAEVPKQFSEPEYENMGGPVHSPKVRTARPCPETVR